VITAGAKIIANMEEFTTKLIYELSFWKSLAMRDEELPADLVETVTATRDNSLSAEVFKEALGTLNEVLNPAPPVKKGTMIIAGKYIIPAACPKDCKFADEHQHQGNLCHRCPVFNCTSEPDENGDTTLLLEPEDYREDWAEQWEGFFMGTIDYPDLKW